MKPWCELWVAEIAGLAFVILYCRNFLYERLICLGGDRDLVGVVVSISPPPRWYKFDWDNDYSINLLLQNTEFDVEQAEAEVSQPYGELIKPRCTDELIPGEAAYPLERPPELGR